MAKHARTDLENAFLLIPESLLALEGIKRFCSLALAIVNDPSADLYNEFARAYSEMLEAETVVIFRVRDGAVQRVRQYPVEYARISPGEVARVVSSNPAVLNVERRIGAHRTKIDEDDSDPLMRLDNVDGYLVSVVSVDSKRNEALVVCACNSRRGSAAELGEDGRADLSQPFVAKQAELLEALCVARHQANPTAIRQWQSAARLVTKGVETWWEHFGALIADALNMCDPYTADHCRNVRKISEVIVDTDKLPRPLGKYELAALRFAAAAHDIGKLAVNPIALNKPSFLSPGERAMVDAHCQLGERMLAHVPGMREVARFVGLHHRWYDGSGGYGKGRMESIPLPARIITVADCFDTMVSQRAYQPVPEAFEEAKREMRGEAERTKKGTQFDPEVVEALCAAIDDGTIQKLRIEESKTARATQLVIEHEQQLRDILVSG